VIILSFPHRYLRLTGSPLLSKLFASDIEVDLMAEIMFVLKEASAQQSECEFILDVLESLGKTSRFTLNLSFLSGDQSQTKEGLFSELPKHWPTLPSTERFQALQATYQIA
jgi:hypothetical protein